MPKALKPLLSLEQKRRQYDLAKQRLVNVRMAVRVMLKEIFELIEVSEFQGPVSHDPRHPAYANADMPEHTWCVKPLTQHNAADIAISNAIQKGGDEILRALEQYEVLLQFKVERVSWVLIKVLLMT
jgi:hypothetical protein